MLRVLRLLTVVPSLRKVVAAFIHSIPIGIIVSTMQELSVLPDQNEANRETHEILERIEGDLAALRKQIRTGTLTTEDRST